jgi:hypothetical protein
MNEKEVYHLIIIKSPETAISEIRDLLADLPDGVPSVDVEQSFWTAVHLYRGEFPGFRACNTEYHNLAHALQTFMTMGRLLHGAAWAGERISPRAITLGLTAAIFHDSGYLQEESDVDGTGAKYTLAHVARSVALLQRLGERFGYDDADLAILEALILSTDLGRAYTSIPYPSAEIEQLGKLLDVADLLAQMSDRNYLEKLLFLFYEFREAGIGCYESEADLLRKTIGFYELVERRLQPTAELADRFLRAHYRRHHNRDINPYRESMLRQKEYLEQVLQQAEHEPEAHLRRNRIVEKVRQRYGS